MKKKELDIPTVLGFKRSFDISDCKIENAIINFENKVTINNTNTNKNDSKADNNIVSGDVCMCNDEEGYCNFSYNIYVSELNYEPVKCNDLNFKLKISEWIKNNKNNETIKLISNMYSSNILNASWLWRNRKRSKNSEINLIVKINGEKDEIINIKDVSKLDLYPIRKTKDGYEETIDIPEKEQLSKLIFDALTTENGLYLEISAKVKIGYLNHVFPSQLFKSSSDSSGRTFAKIEGNPVIKADKINNKLRTFDIFHKNIQIPQKVISIQPKGGDLDEGIFLRSKKLHFNSLLKEIVNDKEINFEEEFFVLANVIRGSVVN